MTTIEREIEAEKRAAGQFVLRELGVTIGMDDYQPEEWFTLERVRDHIWWLEKRAAEGPRRVPASERRTDMDASTTNVKLLQRVLGLERKLSALEFAGRHMGAGRSLDTAAIRIPDEVPVRDYVRSYLKSRVEQTRKDANALARDLLQNLYSASSKDLFEDSDGARVASIESYADVVRGLDLPQLLKEIGILATLTEALDPEALTGLIVHYPWRAWANAGPQFYFSFEKS